MSVQREPMIYAAAGMVFGFVVGYMVANAGGGGAAPPVAVPVTTATPAFVPPASGDRPHEAAATSTPLDPNEVRALESLAARDKSDALVRAQLGNLYMDHGRFDDAARWYAEAVALKPAPDVIVDLGACLVNGGRAAEGLAEFERALKMDPAHKKAAFNKGVALMELGRPMEAVAVWDDLLKRFPDDPQLGTLKRQIDDVRAGAQKRP